MKHVQIGPSALAHGLLIPCTVDAGFEVALIGRVGGENGAEYVQVDTKTGDEVPRRVALAEGPKRFVDASEELREIVKDKEPLLITCTLRKAIIERCRFVEELLEARPPGAETVFAACENTPDPTYKDLEKACKAHGAVPVRTVVNRMCREKKERDVEGRRIILAHPLGEWLFEAPSPSLRLLDELSRVDEVELVKDYDARKDRKIWMVNGVHLVLGLRARAAQLDVFEEPEEDLTETARHPDVLVQLAQLHGPMNEALKRRHPHLEGNLRYGKDHVLAYMEQPDSASRVLSNFNRQDLTPFVETMDERLGEPARICAEAGSSVDAFLEVLDLFETVVKDPGVFVNATKTRLTPEFVAEEADVRAVAAYRKFLGRWADEVEERVARFAGALEISSPH
jgi:hypothetical protein